MAIHYLISSSSKSLQLHCCYLARTATHGAESQTLPQPEKGIKGISQVFEACCPKRNDHPDGQTGSSGGGTTPAQISADTGEQGLTSPALQLHSPASALYKPVPPSPLPARSSTLTPRLVPVLLTCLQLRVLGACRNIRIRPLTNTSG